MAPDFFDDNPGWLRYMLKVFQTVLPLCEDDERCCDLYLDRRELFWRMTEDASVIQGVQSDSELGVQVYDMVCNTLFTFTEEFEKFIDEESLIDKSTEEIMEPLVEFISFVLDKYSEDSTLWRCFMGLGFTEKLFSLLPSPLSRERAIARRLIWYIFNRLPIGYERLEARPRMILSLIGMSLRTVTANTAHGLNGIFDILKICKEKFSTLELIEFAFGDLIIALQSPIAYLFDDMAVDAFCEICQFRLGDRMDSLREQLAIKLLSLELQTGNQHSERAMIKLIIGACKRNLLLDYEHLSVLSKKLLEHAPHASPEVKRAKVQSFS